MNRSEYRSFLKRLSFWERAYHRASRRFVPMFLKLWIAKRAGYVSKESAS